MANNNKLQTFSKTPESPKKSVTFNPNTQTLSSSTVKMTDYNNFFPDSPVVLTESKNLGKSDPVTPISLKPPTNISPPKDGSAESVKESEPIISLNLTAYFPGKKFSPNRQFKLSISNNQEVLQLTTNFVWKIFQDKKTLLETIFKKFKLNGNELVHLQKIECKVMTPNIPPIPILVQSNFIFYFDASNIAPFKINYPNGTSDVRHPTPKDDLTIKMYKIDENMEILNEYLLMIGLSSLNI